MTASFKLRVCTGITAAVIGTAMVGPAHAQDPGAPPPTAPPPVLGGSVGYFGEHGQVVVSTDLDLSIIRTGTSSVMGTPADSWVNFRLQPALDYFASTNFSVGGAVSIAREHIFDTLSDSLTTMGFQGRAGYNLVLTPAVSVWIRGSLGYEHVSFSGGTTDFSGYRIPFGLYAPLLWHPATHFFIGLGPVFATDIISKLEGENYPKFTQFGLQSTIGGYFGGL